MRNVCFQLARFIVGCILGFFFLIDLKLIEIAISGNFYVVDLQFEVDEQFNYGNVSDALNLWPHISSFLIIQVILAFIWIRLRRQTLSETSAAAKSKITPDQNAR